MKLNSFLKPITALLVSIVASYNSAQDDTDHQYTSEAVAAGLRVYTQQCALCHGPEGGLVDGINLSRGEFRNASSDADLRDVISGGAAAGRMPAFSLSIEELSGVIAYIRAGFDPEGVAIKIGDPERGRVLFEGKGECAACHRVNGFGPYTAPDRPVRLVTRNEETVTGRRLNEDTYTVQMVDSQNRLRSFVKTDLVSYEISMEPSKGPTNLSIEEVADVVGYLLTLRGKQ
jgi:mono/diheme cytochrome c family protein